MSKVISKMAKGKDRDKSPFVLGWRFVYNIYILFLSLNHFQVSFSY